MDNVPLQANVQGQWSRSKSEGPNYEYEICMVIMGIWWLAPTKKSHILEAQK